MLSTYIVLYVSCSQSNETGGSHGMEKEGLVRTLNKLTGTFGLQVDTLVTDRHPQIIKHVREQMKTTKHMFDVWHVEKCESALCSSPYPCLDKLMSF